jgi:hypothetical protein
METNVEQYILSQPVDRQGVLSGIHSIILEEDKTVVAIVEPMMGKQMIVYKGKGFMKYGLASVKRYMSLHVMPIYGSATLYAKYDALLPKANFQKGCINFDTADQMPLDIIRQLFVDCATVDLLKMKQDYLEKKKIQGKPKNKLPR